MNSFDGPQDDFGPGLHIILGNQLEVRDGDNVYPLVPGGHYKDEDVAQSLLVLQLINTLLGKENQYLASLAGIGIQAEGVPLCDSNRYHLKKTLGLLNDCRFDAIEFVALTPKTRQKTICVKENSRRYIMKVLCLVLSQIRWHIILVL